MQSDSSMYVFVVFQQCEKVVILFSKNFREINLQRDFQVFPTTFCKKKIVIGNIHDTTEQSGLRIISCHLKLISRKN